MDEPFFSGYGVLMRRLGIAGEDASPPLAGGGEGAGSGDL